MKPSFVFGAILLAVARPALAQSDLPTKKVLTLAVAKRIAEAAEAEALKR